jgi:hypothetical protein
MTRTEAMQMRKTIYVPLTWEEFVKLREVATNECRDPREQARYLVRVGLGMTDQEKHNDAVMNFGETHGAVAAIAG